MQEKEFFLSNLKLPEKVDLSEPYFDGPSVGIKKLIVQPGKRKLYHDLSIDQINAFSPIKVSETCRLTGILPWKSPTRNNSSWGQDVNILSYYKETKDERLPSFHDYIMVSGNWLTNKVNLQRMAEPSYPSYNYEKYLHGIKSRNDFPVYGIDVPDSKHVFSVEVNPDSFSGVVTSLLLGQSKREAYSYGVLAAYRILCNIKKSENYVFDQSLYAVGGREKRNQIDITKKPESRLVLMPELTTTLIGQLYAQPITKCLIENSAGSIYLGQSYYNNGSERICSQFQNFFTVCETDWSHFDSDVTETEIVLAFGILRSFYPRSEVTDKVFIFLLSGFLSKNVVTPDGFIYKITKGIPSGSPFTSLVGTIVNWIRWSALFSNEIEWKPFKDDFSLAICGDDVLIGLPFGCPIPDKFHERIQERTGGVIEDLNENTGFFSTDSPDRSRVFLKYCFISGLPFRRAKDYWKVALIPAKNRRSKTLTILRLRALMLICPFNSSENAVVSDIIRYLLSLKLCTGENDDFIFEFIEKIILKLETSGVSLYTSNLYQLLISEALIDLEKPATKFVGRLPHYVNNEYIDILSQFQSH